MNRPTGALASSLDDILPIAATAQGTHGVLDGDGEFTSWAAAETQSRRLACGLIQAGVRPGDRVAIAMFKSTRSFLAMHAVLRSGAIAVPLDPMGTRPYIASILDATLPTAIVADDVPLTRLVKPALQQPDAPTAQIAPLLITTGDTSTLQEWKPAGSPVLTFEDCGSDAATDAALPAIDPDDDAYILFTSGSTGRPKGIVHTHASALAYVTAAIDVHALTPESRLAGTAPLHFDMSTLELFSVPLAGGTAVTVTEAEKRFPASLSEKLERHAVSHLYAVPFLLRQLDDNGALDERDLTSLAHISFAGEPMSQSLLSSLMTRFPEATFVNAYGPAETNVVTSREFSGAPWTTDIVPIGGAWPQVQLRIVDSANTTVASGSTGELLVAAPTCMRSYWHDTNETDRRFASIDGTSWYRTGDLVFAKDDELFFAGRVDNQVKIRGVRIELEAVEATLQAEPSVAHAVVLKTTDAHESDQLQAFVVTTAGAVFHERTLRLWCNARLNGAAVPGRFHHVPSLPVSANGKIDRNALIASLTNTPRTET